ncbi:dienelactone hydrolase endo-1-3,1,4-beta-D-glucanase [Rhizopogon vinicolor AM-OR11-026]|uniref:Dienelactone hydrolase endo-1-3,1,4-beta-D-glucanase n=1 Tax=Rhizopogon vinicolor AM-OR11-026 TaxID=1314800 RepID=A0A1B7NA48_9AGAM|nr:dienelactone hydrolase endo-1-3,1,4-beta-D-glucanase [Rhizopogon vinicolor AM-OR11-026]
MSCPDCNRGSILEGNPTGLFTEIHGVKAYLASGAHQSRAIILLSDVFGLPLVNSHLLADKFSKELSCDVWIPDLFDGQPPLDVDGMTQDLMPKRPDIWPLWDKIKFIFMIGLPRIGIFFRNRASVVDPRATAFIQRVREQRKYEKVGIVGYCFGGSLGVRLSPLNIFDSLVVCHPGAISEAEVNAINCPTSWVCAEDDMSFGPAIRSKAEALLEIRKGKENYVDYEFVDYKGTVHGFACRPHLEFPDVKEAFEGSINQTVKWFEKTLSLTSESSTVA